MHFYLFSKCREEVADLCAYLSIATQKNKESRHVALQQIQPKPISSLGQIITKMHLYSQLDKKLNFLGQPKLSNMHNNYTP